MKKFLSISFVVVVCSLLANTQASSVKARSTRIPQQATSEELLGGPGTVSAVIELDSEPVAKHQIAIERVPRTGIDFESPNAREYEGQIDREHDDFKSRAGLLAPSLRVRAEFRRLANAVSIEATPTELAAIAALPGVKRVEMVKEFHAMLDASVPLINAPAVWQKLGGVGAAGQGVKIAILDTGIDITNPMFSGDGFTMPAGFPKTNNQSDALT